MASLKGRPPRSEVEPTTASLALRALVRALIRKPFGFLVERTAIRIPQFKLGEGVLALLLAAVRSPPEHAGSRLTLNGETRADGVFCRLEFRRSPSRV